MSKPSDDIQKEIFELLHKHYPGKQWRWQFVSNLEEVMEGPSGGEFVRLMQKWLASV